MELNRRKFLGAVGIGATSHTLLSVIRKIGVIGVGAATLDTLLSGCAGSGQYTIPKNEERYVYPRLPGSKIQAPIHGCLIGFHSSDYRKRRERRGYSFLEKKIGMGPKILVPPWGIMRDTYIRDPDTKILNVPEKLLRHNEAYHFFYRDMENALVFTPLDQLHTDRTFISQFTEYGKNITKLARPMFFTTLHEFNGDWYPWGKKPKEFKKAWRFMHGLFDDVGANEYATWIWESYMHLGPQSRTDHPEQYYPGDEFVDWIGLSVHRQDQYEDHNWPFSHIAGATYRSLHKNHPEKPFLISEIGATENKSQAKWFKDAFHYIRRQPQIKGAVIFDNLNPDANYMHLLSDETWAALREIFKDPYFLGFRK